MTVVLGVDPSHTSTGIAYRKPQTDRVLAYALGNPKLRGMPRLRALREGMGQWLDRVSPDLVVLEDYAYQYRGKSNIIIGIGELGGILRMLILDRGIDILLVPPTSLKLFATGSGAGRGEAGKEAVALAMRNELGVQFSTSDQYDATALLLLGESYKDKKGLPEHRQRAIDGCTLLPGF